MDYIFLAECTGIGTGWPSVSSGAERMEQVDFVVIGAGISGASAACELAERGSVCLLEAEDQPGYHSTGRSAALYTANFGAPLVRLLNAAGFDFFHAPPAGFTDVPLVTPRGALTLAKPGQEAALAALIAAADPRHPIRAISLAEAQALAPVMRPGLFSAAAYEAGVLDMDVGSLHQGYLRRFRQRGGQVRCRRPVTALTHQQGRWLVQAGGEDLSAAVVINAAGAWGDAIGALARAQPVGLVPKRRTALIIDAPADLDVAALPLVEYLGEGPYLKPEAGAIMASLGDETPVPPQDIQPEELDIALIADWLERHSILTLKRAPRAWAGLRSFVADGNPIAGFDPVVPGFFWLVGQGGYGIMMAPTLARITASLASGAAMPADLAAGGITAAALAPGRAIYRK